MGTRLRSAADVKLRSPIVREIDSAGVVLRAIEIQLGRSLTTRERARVIRGHRTLVAELQK